MKGTSDMTLKNKKLQVKVHLWVKAFCLHNKSKCCEKKKKAFLENKVTKKCEMQAPHWNYSTYGAPLLISANCMSAAVMDALALRLFWEGPYAYRFKMSAQHVNVYFAYVPLNFAIHLKHTVNVILAWDNRVTMLSIGTSNCGLSWSSHILQP